MHANEQLNMNVRNSYQMLPTDHANTIEASHIKHNISQKIVNNIYMYMYMH